MLFLALILAVLPLGSRAQDRDADLAIPDDAVQAEYIESIDGDTIRVEMDNGNGRLWEYTVRLIGIDTPETSYSYGNEPECYGDEASKRSESLLAAAEEVWLEADKEDEDDFGRLLRYVWYVSGDDGDVHLLNEDLVREGYALAKSYRPNTSRQDDLDRAERDASEDGRGLWAACDAAGNWVTPQEQDDPAADTVPPAEDEPESACSYFETRDEAQDALDAFPDLADLLDADGDGIACESYF